MKHKHECEFWEDGQCNRRGTHKCLVEFSRNFTLALVGFTEKDNHKVWYCNKHFKVQMRMQKGIISEVT